MSSRAKRVCTFAAALLPSILARPLLRALGHIISPGATIGLSFVYVDRLLLGRGARIGHFNLLRLETLLLRDGAYIGRGNVVHGPLRIALGSRAALGNSNIVSRGGRDSVTYGRSSLRLGELAKITSGHRIDCTCTVVIGKFSTIAGVGSQIWTHGYVHELTGDDRYRVDGAVRVGNNVYVGSGCILCAGVRVASGVMVGAGATVARDLSEPGLYVEAALRQLPRPADPRVRADLEPVCDERLADRVYRKRDTDYEA